MLNFVTKTNYGIADAEMHWANFVCENNLPVRLSDSFINLVAKMFPGSDIDKNFSCGRTKTNQIVTQAIGSCAEEIFTTQVETHLYKVVALCGKATDQNRFNVVNSSFEEDNIPWQNCISMSSDGAKSVFLHCTCPRLAASHACSELSDFFKQLPRDVYTYFKVSGKRQDEFRNIQHFLMSRNTKYYARISPGGLQCYSVLDHLLEQWSALTEYFELQVESKESNSESMRRIKETLHSQSAKLYFLFLKRPYVNKLYSEMSVLVCKFTAIFVQFSAIQQAFDVTSIDFGSKNQLPKQVFSLAMPHEHIWKITK
ncbi:hypothetical protein PR048_016902 [Dryococelus australis]|uniref:SWIM-type domain-containing protein n=1 Tax=Dryococelus australis TaxID=614101 RepID=A0ABQ9H8K1_9NEOP|nr:hypothetical protein PR048_016902 [Dryococelus australis]